MDISLLNNLKVLYIDDEPENLLAFRYALLDTCGDNVVTHTNPVAALDVLAQDLSIGVLVVNHPLSGMDLFTFLHQATLKRPDLVVVVFSAQVDDPLLDKKPGASRVCWRYVAKDWALTGNHLVALIREAGALHAQGQALALLGDYALEILMRIMGLCEKDSRARRVLRLCEMLLPYLDIPLLDKEMLLLAAIYYDVGRLVTTAGLQEDREHVRLSEEILRGLSGLEQCRLGALDHHERWDGSGFPEGKKQEQISLFGRILAVVHAFDQATVERVRGGRALSLDHGRAFLQDGSGTRFDPEIVTAFLQMMQDCWDKVTALYRTVN